MEEKNNNDIDVNVIEKHFREILDKGLKVDINDPNFLETPKRVAKAYKEIFAGLDHTKEDIKIFSKHVFRLIIRGLYLRRT